MFLTKNIQLITVTVLNFVLNLISQSVSPRFFFRLFDVFLFTRGSSCRKDFTKCLFSFVDIEIYRYRNIVREQISIKTSIPIEVGCCDGPGFISSAGASYNFNDHSRARAYCGLRSFGRFYSFPSLVFPVSLSLRDGPIYIETLSQRAIKS